MPYMETITEGQAIVIAEALLDADLVDYRKMTGRRMLVDAIIEAGRVEVGQVFIPRGDYEDWFEGMDEPETLEGGDDPIMFREVSVEEKSLADTLIRLVDESSKGKEV